MEIEKLLTDAETAGVQISLTPDGKVRLAGAAAAVRDTAKALRPHRNTLVEYLKQCGAVVVRAPEGVVNETIELDAEGGVASDDTPSTPQFAFCPKCREPLIAPSPEIQIRNFARWQHEHSSYFWWTESQLTRLEEHLAANPADVLILPSFAHSVSIRRPDGSVYTHFRVK